MDWFTFDKEQPDEDGLYLITVCQHGFVFQEKDGTQFECEERRFVRQAELLIMNDGQRMWVFLNEDEDGDERMYGEYQKSSRKMKIVSGDDALEIMAWADMPFPYEGDKK